MQSFSMPGNDPSAVNSLPFLTESVCGFRKLIAVKVQLLAEPSGQARWTRCPVWTLARVSRSLHRLDGELK